MLILSRLTPFGPLTMVRPTLGGYLWSGKPLAWVVLVMADSDDRQQSLTSLKAKTGSLAERIRKARSDRSASEAARTMRQGEMTGAGRGLRMASEIVAAVIVGAILGFGLDSLLGTRPLFLVVMFMVGFAAGVLNVVRAAADMNANAPQPDPDELVPVDDDDDDD